MAGLSDDVDTVFLCLEASDLLLEPMCTTWELQQELVPYVLSHSLQHDHFLKLPKAERQAKVKILTQRILSGETGAPSGDEEESPGQMRMVEALSPHRFWAHLRAKYGTRLGSILDMLQLLEPMLRPRSVKILRFEGEVSMPSASLILRASQPCPNAAGAQETWQKDFEPETFSTAALNTWLSEVSTARAPPLWSRLAAAKERAPGLQAKAFALILCAQATSTETIPEALAVAGRSLCEDHQPVPYLSAVSFGADFTSERLQALEELCAWSGGLSFNVDEPGMLRPAAEGLSAHLFGEAEDSSRFFERRRYYAQKQELGTCFMELPRLVKYREGESTPSVTPLHLHRKTLAGLPALLMKASSLPIDYAVPSESMLTVLSDVTLVLAHRWSRSLRVWRIRRGMRDLVFGEPGSIGLDFEEPTPEGETGNNTWRLRATHPPASALKMQEGSELVAINRVRVTERTPRSEVARRISSRPVSLTFRLPRNTAKEVSELEVLPMVVAEIVVSELREGLAPLKTAQPPLSTALQKYQEVKARKVSQAFHQATRLLRSIATWGTVPGTSVPAWVEDLPVESPLGRRWAKTASLDLFAREPGLLFRVLMFCGEVSTVSFAGRSCSTWQRLLLDTAQRSTRQLWSWVLRHGRGVSPQQRPGFWRWCLMQEEDGGVHAALFAAAHGTSGYPKVDGSQLAEECLLEAVARSDGSGSLSRLSSGLGGAVPSLQVATASMQELSASLGLPRLPSPILDRLLQDPYHLQRLWLLSDAALPWLVMQCRYFQVAIAAHVPNLFRHLMGEGLAPELFFCRWIQGLFQGCISSKLQLQIMDHFILERSFKVFVKLAVAIFMLLEKRLIGQDIEKMMDLLFDSQAWELKDEELLSATFEVKVTRTMLKEIQ